MEGPLTPAQLMANAVPQWQRDPFVDPLANPKKRTMPPRRVYPLNVNLPPAKNSLDGGSEMELASVGTGAPVYMEPEDGASGDEARHRFRSLKSSPGEGAEVLKGAEEEDLEVIFKRIKEKNESPFTVTSDETTIRVGGNDVDVELVQFNIGGSISCKDGLITALEEGVRGGTGSIEMEDCEENRTPLISWEQGLIVTDPGEEPLVIRLGNCMTDSEGS